MRGDALGSPEFSRMLDERVDDAASSGRCRRPDLAPLTVERDDDGAKLHNRLQHLRARVSVDAFTVTSTSPTEGTGAFELRVARWGRVGAMRRAGGGTLRVDAGEGHVAVSRSGFTERYTNTTDGIRQDFVIHSRPEGKGFLLVALAITGATAAPSATGARLTLACGRELTYDRLRVTDANGATVDAGFEFVDDTRLAIVVDDEASRYPLRIDPTVSDADWIALSSISGADDDVEALLQASSGDLYVAGLFTSIGDVTANHIAMWDGSNWSTLGTGTNNNVYALAEMGGDIYAGGYFTQAGGVSVSRVARWDGSQWYACGSGITNRVSAMAAFGGNLYVGGQFTTPGSVADYIAMWDGATWSAVGAGVDDVVYAMTATATELYVGGDFLNAGGSTALYVASWDDSVWSDLDAGTNDRVRTLATDGTNLYAGGYFTGAGNVTSITANRVAMWNGSVWSALGTGMNSVVYSLTTSGGDLYAGGNFTNAGGNTAARVAKWSGGAWSALGSGVNSNVLALAVVGGDVFAGGWFATAGGNPSPGIARWSGTNWFPMSGGINDYVRAFAISGADAYAGGDFTTAGQVDANYVARWNGSDWAALGLGTDGTVLAIAVSGSDVYVGGTFTLAGGAAASRVAHWNGAVWAALGSGMNGTVRALATDGTDLYAGGDFTTAGGASAPYIARWNGAAWSSLGTGMNARVRSLVVSGTEVYAGGDFTLSDSVTTNRIAVWSGSAWSALGSGTNNTVDAIAVNGTDVYAAGSFTLAGGTGAARVAHYNGSSWSALGSGMDNPIYALAYSWQILYAGGAFLSAGGSPASRVAAWDGSSWSTLGSGTDISVYAMAASGGKLFVGGQFTTAGGSVTPYAALMQDPAPLIVSIAPADANPTNATSVGFTVTFDESVTGIDTGDFALAASGVTGNILSVSGSGTVYTVTVDTVSGNGTIGLDLAASPTILDLAGQALAGPFTGGTYTVDTVAPNLQTITRADGSPTNAASVGFTVDFDNPMSGVVAGDFSLTTSGTAAGAIAGVSGSGSSYTVTVGTLTGDGTLRLDLVPSPAATDLAGNALPGPFTSGEAYDIDRVLPAVVSIVRVDASPSGAAAVDYTVAFDETVTGVDAADFVLTLTGTVGGAVGSVVGSGDTYTVTVDTITGEGTLRLDVDGGAAIQDGVGNALPVPYTAGEVYDIDGGAPGVSSIVRADGSPTNAAAVDYTVTFNETVVLVDATDFVLTATGTASGTVASVAGSGDTYTVTVNTVAGEGTLRLDIAAGAVIQDDVGNALPAPYTAGEAYDIDRVAPGVVSIQRADANPTNAASVDFTVTFDENVTGVDAADFAVTTTGTAAGAVALVAGSGDTYTVTVDAISGEGSLRLDVAGTVAVQDVVGNALGAPYTSGEAYTIDRVIPTVTSIVRADANPTNAASVDYTVTISEAVTGVGTTDFALTPTGTAAGSVASVAGSGATYTVTVDTITGEGTLRLDVTVAATIQDALGNALVGPYATGDAYDVDRVAPGAPSVLAIADDTGVSDDEVTSDATLVISGTAEAGSSVEVFIDVSTSLGTATADGIGVWSLDNTGSPIGEGAHDLTAIATDAAGNTGPLSAALAITIDTTPPDAPVVTGDVTTTEQAPTWTWSPGASAGIGDYRYQLDTEAGTWTQTTAETLTPATNLAAGLHTLYVQERDLAGNWSPSGSFGTTIVGPSTGSGGGGCVPGAGGPATLVFAILLALFGVARRIATPG